MSAQPARDTPQAFAANAERLRDGLARVAARMRTDPPADMTQAEVYAARQRLRDGLRRKRERMGGE